VRRPAQEREVGEAMQLGVRREHGLAIVPPIPYKYAVEY
jgi:hypothetical protein